MEAKTRTDCRDLRKALLDLKLNEAIRVEFERPKRCMGAYMSYVVKPLAPRRFSYRVIDEGSEVPGKVIGVWRVK